MDYLIRGMDKGKNYRIFAVKTTNIVETARINHDTWPIATAALGRVLTGALLLGANLKGEDLITLRVIGDGPLGAIIVSANSYGEVRGYVHEPHVDLPRKLKGKLPVGDAVGRGTFSVTKDLGLKSPFIGSVQLVSGEIAEDITHYLHKSEQSASAVALGVFVDKEGRVESAGGFWLEILPGADEELIDQIEKRLSELPPISSIIGSGATPQEIAAMVTGDNSLSFLGETPVVFRCSCHREKVKSILYSLGKPEITSISREKGYAEVRCHFCGEKYHFQQKELEALIEEIN
jgi:molecular chaperone Hsp33